MELKEYLQIIKKDIKSFVVIILLMITGVFLYFYLKPVSYRTFLTLNITRQNSEDTQDYRYDGFYRLQADEKFAETVVEWIKSPRVAADAKLPSGASPEKRSSQMVSVSFLSTSPEVSKKISSDLVKVVSENTDELNESQKEKNWFKIMASEPVIVKNVPNYRVIFPAALLAGMFAAFWFVMIRHYLK